MIAPRTAGCGVHHSALCVLITLSFIALPFPARAAASDDNRTLSIHGRTFRLLISLPGGDSRRRRLRHRGSGQRARAGVGRRDRGRALGARTMLHLRCATGDMAGLEWDVLHPMEPVELLRVELRPDFPASLAAWRLHHQACLLDGRPRPADMLATEPGRMQIEPYQHY